MTNFSKPTTHCFRCGVEVEAGNAFCDSCRKPTENHPSNSISADRLAAPTAQTASNVTLPNMSPQEYALLRRYTDAYRSAKLMVLAGNTVKIIGAVLAFLSLVGGGSLSGGRGPYQEIVAIGGIAAIVLGLLFAALIFIIGILISGQGQTLKATLDSAVNSSPFLTNEQRARIMSLPLS